MIIHCKTKKSLGQHFLKNNKILKILANSLGDIHKELVIEIGGGVGNLTKYLVNAKKLIVYEIDKNLLEILKDKFKSNKNIKIINKDFLKANLKKLNHNFIVVGNIPYFITGKILRKIFNFGNFPKIAILTLQKEYAEKILGRKKENFLSIWIKNFSQVEKIIVIKNKNFFPAPRVDSLALKFNFFPQPVIKNLKFEYFLKNLFKNNKRTVYNNLKLNYSNKISLLDKDFLLKRPHQLKFPEIIRLFYLLEKNEENN
ncbi:MAG: 16S rRNA (adenine(1518)-N(6)/adenine(1519)-N(6))-dimethyltransferase RsmA [Patescibacteria group bacterium]|nr:16S rRNA (adenine(1518)-N(6)/adenine(1519)-N(6))-dimethyltransferase RsmA [Patescibacteria group bacterium]